MDAGAKLGREDAVSMASRATRVIVAKGRKVATFTMKSTSPTDPVLLKNMLGPTGNLRAPTIKAGGTLLVGFNEDVYEKMFAT